MKLKKYLVHLKEYHLFKNAIQKEGLNSEIQIRNSFFENERNKKERHTCMISTKLPLEKLLGLLTKSNGDNFLLIEITHQHFYSPNINTTNFMYDIEVDTLLEATQSRVDYMMTHESVDSDAQSDKQFCRSLALNNSTVKLNDVLKKVKKVGKEHLNPLEKGVLYLSSDEGELLDKEVDTYQTKCSKHLKAIQKNAESCQAFYTLGMFIYKELDNPNAIDLLEKLEKTSSIFHFWWWDKGCISLQLKPLKSQREIIEIEFGGESYLPLYLELFSENPDFNKAITLLQ
jgi:hypothetical protein